MMDRLQKLVDQLKANNQTIGFAESCTGGKLSDAFTSVPGVSAVFLGSVVSYANSVKEEILDVSPDSITKYGAVSPEVATDMARGARKVLRTSWSLAITGVAGPGGGTSTKPVGMVCFSLTGPGFEKAEEHRFQGNREQVREAAVEMAITILERALMK